MLPSPAWQRARCADVRGRLADDGCVGGRCGRCRGRGRGRNHRVAAPAIPALPQRRVRRPRPDGQNGLCTPAHHGLGDRSALLAVVNAGFGSLRVAAGTGGADVIVVQDARIWTLPAGGALGSTYADALAPTRLPPLGPPSEGRLGALWGRHRGCPGLHPRRHAMVVCGHAQLN